MTSTDATLRKTSLDTGDYDTNFLDMVNLVQFVISVMTPVLYLIIEGPPIIMTGYRKMFKGYKMYLLDNGVFDDETEVMIGILSKNLADISIRDRINV